jgi:hypothetical protein
MLTMGCFESSVVGSASTLNTYIRSVSLELQTFQLGEYLWIWNKEVGRHRTQNRRDEARNSRT